MALNDDVLTEPEATVLIQGVIDRRDLNAQQKWHLITAILDRCEATGGRVSW